MSTAIEVHSTSSESGFIGSSKIVHLRGPRHSSPCLLRDIVHAVVEAKPSVEDRTVVHDVLDQCMAATAPMSRKDCVISSVVSALAVVALFGFSFFA